MKKIPAIALLSIFAAAIPSMFDTACAEDKPAMTDEQVTQLFATTCGWCHEDGGRKAAKGPQLMESKRSDEYLIGRIATGVPGKMPAFGHMLNYEQIQAIVRYIRNLKPDTASQEKP